jgi:hypothetical protein
MTSPTTNEARRHCVPRIMKLLIPHLVVLLLQRSHIVTPPIGVLSLSTSKFVPVVPPIESCIWP